MSRILRVFVAMLCAVLLPAAAFALQPLEGQCLWPDAQAPVCVLRYRFEQIDPQTQADEAVNAHYQALVADLPAQAAMQGEQLGLVGETLEMDITSAVTHLSDRYVSIVQTATTFGGNAESLSLCADTFARDGVYAGQHIGLSQVLGLENDDELTTGATVAEELAYSLVWQIVSSDSARADSDYQEGLTQQRVRQAFHPETDFYLDADGNIVFFIASGEIAPEVAGVLTFPFAAAELLSSAAQPY